MPHVGLPRFPGTRVKAAPGLRRNHKIFACTLGAEQTRLQCFCSGISGAGLTATLNFHSNQVRAFFVSILVKTYKIHDAQ